MEEKPLNSSGKTGENPLENLVKKQCSNPQIYRARKTSRWGLSELSVDRPADRPTVIFQTVVPSVDRSADRGQDTESRSLCPDDRPADRGFPESRALWTDDRVGRPALLPELACTSVHVGRPARSTGLSQDRTVMRFKTWSF